MECILAHALTMRGCSYFIQNCFDVKEKDACDPFLALEGKVSSELTSIKLGNTCVDDLYWHLFEKSKQ